MHFGTGNYHLKPRGSTPIFVFHLRSGFVPDAAAMFNYMTGYAKQHQKARLRTAHAAGRNCSRLIDDEIAHAKAGKPAQIWAKLNSLVDPQIIDKLYRASGRRAYRAGRPWRLLPATGVPAFGEYPGQEHRRPFSGA